MTELTIHQPINPEILPRLDPEYVAFHNSHLRHIVPQESEPWDASIRENPKDTPFSGKSVKGVEIGNVHDILLEHAQLRVFTPKGESPIRGWPVFLWFHGGGWTLGDLNSDNGLCSVFCKEANCVVVNVNYRHAPEAPWPAAVEDAMEALGWIARSGKSEIGIDPEKIVLGGTSAGGNLVAIASLKAALASPPIPILGQALIVPVIDNTATVTTVWKTSQAAPWLTPSRMLWYRAMYLPDESKRLEWDASPNLAACSLLAGSPKTWIAVSELDLLAPEAMAFGEQLREVGVEVHVQVYKGSTHSILALSGVLAIGTRLVTEAVDFVKNMFIDTF